MTEDLEVTDCANALMCDAVTGREGDDVEGCPNSLATASSLDSVVEDEFFDNSLGTCDALSKGLCIVSVSREELLRELVVVDVVFMAHGRLGTCGWTAVTRFPDAE